VSQSTAKKTQPRSYGRYQAAQYDNRRGELNPTAKLTADDVRAIRAARRPVDGRRRKADAGTPVGVLAAEYGVDPATITAIVHRYSWRHL
jgi:hypothetical protein